VKPQWRGAPENGSEKAWSESWSGEVVRTPLHPESESGPFIFIRTTLSFDYVSFFLVSMVACPAALDPEDAEFDPKDPCEACGEGFWCCEGVQWLVGCLRCRRRRRWLQGRFMLLEGTKTHKDTGQLSCHGSI
jgi:hypothetical protein